MKHQGKWQSYASLSVIAAVAIAGGALAIIEARAAPPAETASEPAAETEVTVTFDTDPVKTGYVAGEGGTCAESLQRHVYATVSPSSARDDITFTIAQEQDDERVDLSEPEEFDDDQWEFDVGGLSATPADKENGDTTIQAIYKGKVVGEAKAIVVVPSDYEHPGDITQVVAGVNVALTAPAYYNARNDPPDATAGSRNLFATKYGIETDIKVLDQFGKTLDECYVGQSVKEEGTIDVGPPPISGYIDIAVDIRSGGVYTDQIAHCMPKVQVDPTANNFQVPFGQGPHDKTYQEFEDWWLAATLLPTDAEQSADIGKAVSIGGHQISKDKMPRTLTVVPIGPLNVSATITVHWN